jgi:cytochrome b561
MATPRTAIALHWIVGLLILGNLAFGLYVAGLPISPRSCAPFRGTSGSA